ncbi:TRAP transporter substrate-binding protein [Pseudochrobactrum sp. sp1633]|uniref:TRAP transporter substrate-binding protein n=1 Tax=Pseudochrobactrum sp. sp1633 TaxID=3036706 RepID=UPI0025A5922E|nr:TRAP transporter substrate-binding protein [Pseudochrobactrum sp. sp1633]MDM8347177.1 TRAP transporter substrate-binding protein [Pseudochrobactrum sp. sp1633]
MSVMKVTLSALAVFMTSATCVMAQTVKWDMPNEYNQTSIPGVADEYFAKILKEKTGGAIEIMHHFGGALGYKGPQMLDAVGSGAVPIGNLFAGPLSGIDPLFLLSSLPFVAATPEEAKKLLDVSRDQYEAVFLKNNQKMLYAMPWPPSGIWARSRIDNLDSLKGLKIRTYDPSGTKTFSGAGATPLQVSWADTVPQVGAGVLDGVLTSAELGNAAKLWEQLPYFTGINYSMPLNIVTINLDVWDELSPELQQAVTEAGIATENHQWATISDHVIQDYKVIRDNNGTVIEDPAEDLMAALKENSKGAIDDWLAKIGDRGQTILGKFKQ